MQELQSLAEQTISICSPIEEIQTGVAKVVSSYQTFRQGMLNDKTSGISRESLDQNRDYPLFAFFQTVKYERFYPYEDERAKIALQQLVVITKKYGPKLVKLGFNEQSLAIDKLLEEVTRIENLSLVHSGVIRWINVIEEANTAYKSGVKDSGSKSAKLLHVDSATKLAPYLVEALSGLYTLLFAHVQISGEQRLKDVYVKLHTLVDSFLFS
jgi:hypothetical protein